MKICDTLGYLDCKHKNTLQGEKTRAVARKIGGQLCFVGRPASIFLDFLVLLRQGKSTMKFNHYIGFVD